ncbi:myeloperoxidase-like [Cylas formicarius]|uniref:myeloperoxidase-like n=1 Tax=Cylas formicarius TaxID=197179 RepID=UPI002958CAE1|nr:myeloperoxidase-like [Cylas formicarius]XP_060521833.1 myeloperoxidase-like [Cylas formicarius]
MALVALFPIANETTTIRRTIQNDLNNVDEITFGERNTQTNDDRQTTYSQIRKENESSNNSNLKVVNLGEFSRHNRNLGDRTLLNNFNANNISKNKFKKYDVRPQQQEVDQAVEDGMELLRNLVQIKEPLWYKQGLYLDETHPATRVAKFGAPMNRKAIALSNMGYAMLEATQRLVQSYRENVHTKSPSFPNDIQPRISPDECPFRDHARCPLASKRFRTPNGICNNVDQPWRGAAMVPLQRFLPPAYQDGIQSIKRSILGHQLPSPREISTKIHRDKNVELESVTLMFMQWGQFIDHDLVSVVKSRSFNGSIPRCCDMMGRGFLPSNFTHPSCLPIEVPRDDWFFSQFGIRCMEFVRSAPSIGINCHLGWREQINQVTSFIDASMIYGNDLETLNFIRTFRGGKIIYGRSHLRGPLNPPNPEKSELCRAGAITEDCMEAGDARLGEQPGLIAMHTVFVRYHNKIATVLSKLNKHWSDERTFQETRKIVYSAIQHITYREFLPLVVGPEVTDLFELRLKNKGFYTLYDSKFDPGVANSFATAAFRFGHSMVQNSFIRTDSQHMPLSNNVSLHEELNNAQNIWSFGAVDRLLLGLSNQASQKRDEFMASELTNHLFQFSDAFSFGMDLGAINIQRGRDHGIPSYTSWRAPCGLNPIRNWTDLEKIMNVEVVSRLKSLYDHIDDVDLFTGGLAERPLRGSVVGPTFACIIAQQFLNLRRGDRFWYENGGFESSFTPAQLQQIRKVSLSQILCQTMNEIETIQEFVFLSPDNVKNRRVPCNSRELRSFNLGVWAEKAPNVENDQPNTKKIKRSSASHDPISAQTKYAELNTVPKRPAFQSNRIRVQDSLHSEVSYLFGVVPEQTTINSRPIEININIQYHPQTTTKQKKRPNNYYLTTGGNTTRKPQTLTTERPNGHSNYHVYSQTHGYHGPTPRPVTSAIVTINQQRPNNYFDRKPLDDYNYNLNQQTSHDSTYERPFVSLNKPLYNDDYIDDDGAVTYNIDSHRPHHLQDPYHRDRIDVDDIQEQFFANMKDGPLGGKLDIDDKLDFKSRVISNRDTTDDKRFVKISAAHADTVSDGRNYNHHVRVSDFAERMIERNNKPPRKVRIVDLDVVPSGDSDDWEFSYATEPTPDLVDVPELPSTNQYSEELPKLMTKKQTNRQRGS